MKYIYSLQFIARRLIIKYHLEPKDHCAGTCVLHASVTKLDIQLVFMVLHSIINLRLCIMILKMEWATVTHGFWKIKGSES